jgi:CBS domain-containing protein
VLPQLAIAEGRTARNTAVSPLLTVPSDEPFARAAQLMAEVGIGRAPDLGARVEHRDVVT